MIGSSLLQALVAFAQEGTVAKTAQRLHLTQPAVSHALKQIEAALGVKLFIRHPNRIYLNETGKFTARQAKKILLVNQDFVRRVHHFDESQRTVTIAANAPGPLIVLKSLPRMTHVLVRPKFVSRHFAKLLTESQVTCLLINRPLSNRDITNTYLGTENMSVNLPQNDPLASKRSLTYQSLSGRTIVSSRAIGFWQNIYQKQVPKGKFIYQKQNADYTQILKYSALPFFTTNLTQLDQYWQVNLPKNRLTLAISDPIAHQKFYACFLKRNKRRLAPLLQQLRAQWVKVD